MNSIWGQAHTGFDSLCQCSNIENLCRNVYRNEWFGMVLIPEQVLRTIFLQRAPCQHGVHRFSNRCLLTFLLLFTSVYHSWLFVITPPPNPTNLTNEPLGQGQPNFGKEKLRKKSRPIFGSGKKFFFYYGPLVVVWAQQHRLPDDGSTKGLTRSVSLVSYRLLHWSIDFPQPKKLTHFAFFLQHAHTM